MVLRISTTSIRYRKEFNSANKHTDETLKNWYDRLTTLAESCDYGIYLEAFILNQFVCGLDALILEYFYAEQKDLSLNDVFDLTKSFEHSNEVVDVKQVWTSIKIEALDLSDDGHYNDNTFNDSDDDYLVLGTAEVDNVRPHVEVESVWTNGVKKDNTQPVVTLTVNRAIELPEQSKSFECFLCHKTFTTAGRLTFHFTCYHSIRKTSKSKSTVKRKTPRPLKSQEHLFEQPKSFECYLCHETMKTAGKLLYHFALYHTIGKTSNCILCGKWIADSSNMLRHLNAHLNVKEFFCNMCDAGFRLNKSLKRHLLEHDSPNVKEYKCPKCSKIFILKISLNEHLKEHKRPAVPLSEKLDNLIRKQQLKKKKQLAQDGKYKCNICATQFNKESELNVHSKVHDDNECLCHLCGLKLLSKRNLKVHYRVHTNEKAFACDKCGRAFSTGAKRNRHVRMYHTPLGRPHKCTLCEKKFTQKCHLRVHLKAHQRFKCDQCPRDFYKVDQLARHKLTHSGILKPWKCAYCQHGFKTNYLRVEHERTHTGEKPYSCPICSKHFAQQSSLRGHRKVHLKPLRPMSERAKKRKQKLYKLIAGSGMVEAADVC